MKHELLNRVKALEAAFVPPDPWRLTVKFSDGHSEIMSAKQYRQIKEQRFNDVRVIDKILTGNLQELDNWLQTVRDEAERMSEHDCCRSPTSPEEWELYGSEGIITI